MSIDVAANNWYKEKGQFRADAKEVAFNLARLAEWFGAGKCLHDIRTSDIAKLVTERRGKTINRGGEAVPLSNATVNRRDLEPLRGLWNWAKRRNVKVSEIDWPSLFLPEPKERIREISDDVAVKLFENLRPDLHDFFLFLKLTGLRKAEALSMTWGIHTDTKAGVLRGLRVKGGHQRDVYLSEGACALIEAQRGNHEVKVWTYIAREKGHKHHSPMYRVPGQRYPLTKGTIRRPWDQARETAGVPDLRIHDIRHDFAMKALRAGGNLRAVQRLLGHTQISTTTRYADALEGDQRATLKAMEGNKRKERKKG